MNSHDSEPFRKLVSDVMSFYGKDVSSFVFDVWWNACRPFDYEQVCKAFTAHATDPDHGQFAPKPADIVRQLAGTKTDQSLRAWSKVHSAMSEVGAYADVCFDDPAIHRVIEDMGGWPKMCRAPLTELSYMQHRFCESYRAYAGRTDYEAPLMLAGDTKRDGYASRGLEAPKPTMIGIQNCLQKLQALKGGVL